MFKKKECIAMLLAGGQGSRLYTLTEKTAKPAVPFGGKYRIIDFPMSNCVNSGIDTVGVLTGIASIAALPPVGAAVLIALSILLTVIAGLFPAKIASKKDPVIALRTE